MREAFRQAHALKEHFDILVEFTDAQVVLHALQRSEGSPIIDDIVRVANALYDEGISVEVHWVPGLGSVEEHVRVDEMSRRYRVLASQVAPMDLSKIRVEFEPLTLEHRWGKDIEGGVERCDGGGGEGRAVWGGMC